MRRNNPQSSSIPRSELRYRSRSSSVDCVSRGSYLPSRRTSSAERFSQGSARKQYPRLSPKMSAVNRFLSRTRGSRGGSLLDNKRIPKDPRPLSDKSYQKQCIFALIEFLECSDFPHAISPNNLMNPTKKDFEKIFQFLYNFWDPNYEAHKIEEEIPKIMKSFNYPFLLNKSSFLTITRTSWPTLLGVLVWLMELNKFAMSIDINDYFVSCDFDSAEEKRILHGYILQSYESGIDDPIKDEAVFTNLVMGRGGSEYSTEELQEMVMQKEAVLAKTNEDLAEYYQLEESNKQKESDISNYETFFSKMESHLKQKEIICETLREEKDKKEKDLLTLKKTVSEKESIYKNQGFDGQQAQNFYAVQKKNLIHKLDEKMEQLKEEEKVFWDLEIELSQLTDKVETLCQKFNDSYANLRTELSNALSPLKNTDIPAAVKLCKDFKIVLSEFEMHPHSHRTSYARWKDEIKPSLDKAKSYLEKQVDHIRSIKTVQEHHLHEVHMKLSDMNIKKQLISAKCTHKGREIEEKEMEYQKDMQVLEQNCENLTQKCAELHDEILKIEKYIVELKKKKMNLHNEKEKNEQDYETYSEASKTFHINVNKLVIDSIKKQKIQKKKLSEKEDELLKLVEKMSSINDQT